MSTEKNSARSRRLAGEVAPIFLNSVEDFLRSDHDKNVKLTIASNLAQIVLALHQTGNRLD